MEERAFRRKVVMVSFICCLLVIWNHSGNADLFLPGTGPETWLYQFEYQWAYALVRLDIPFFMMISGYLFFRNMSSGNRITDFCFPLFPTGAATGTQSTCSTEIRITRRTYSRRLFSANGEAV